MPATLENCCAIQDSGKTLLIKIPELDDTSIWACIMGFTMSNDSFAELRRREAVEQVVLIAEDGKLEDVAEMEQAQ